MNTLPVIHEAPNLIVLEPTHRKRSHRGRQLPKGITRIGNTLYINFQRDGQRIRQTAGTDSVMEAVALLDRKKAEVIAGVRIFENQPKQEVVQVPKVGPEKVLFKDFALEAIRKKAPSEKGGYTYEEALIFLGEDKASMTAKNKIKNELMMVKFAGKKPRFVYKSINGYFENLRKIMKFFGEMEMPIDPDTVGEYIQLRKLQARAGNTIRNEILTLSNIFRWGLKSKRFRNSGWVNPYDVDSHKQSKGDSNIRYLTWEERVRFHQAIDTAKISFPKDLFKDVSEFAPLIGLRIENIFELKISQFKLEKGQYGWILFDSWGVKAKRMIDQPIVYERAREIVLRRMEGKTENDLLFPYPQMRKRGNGGNQILYNAFKRAFDVVCETAKIKDATPHSWKKTFLMELGVRGDTKEDIQLLGQHTDWKTTQGSYYDERLVREEREKRNLLPISIQNRMRGGFFPTSTRLNP